MIDPGPLGRGRERGSVAGREEWQTGDVGPGHEPGGGESRGDGPRGGGRGPVGGAGGWLLRARMPVWLAVALLMVVAVTFTVVMLTRDEVDLGPAVDGATNARVALTVCNEIVDSREINPRAAELRLERALTDLGARQADVVIDRIDCGPEATAPARD